MLALCIFFLVVITSPHAAERDGSREKIPLTQEKYYHIPKSLTNEQIATLSDLTNITHMNEVLDNICVVRIVGTTEHARVKQYIKRSMKGLGWTVESNAFQAHTPIFGKLKFENIIAKLNPNARRYLVLACHFDSKYTREGDFIGATDSAVPCAQLINLATVMSKYLTKQHKDVSLMFIFFDGEEAFQEWGPNDSIYGAKHLAKEWYNKKNYDEGIEFRELDRMDILVLLDLLGAPDPIFYNYFKNTEKWYSLLVSIEQKLARMRKFESYSYGRPEQRYFQPYSYDPHIEDDHTPFLKKNVSILHIIPTPFPPFWHKSGDNRHNIDLKTTENINKILRIFTASYLHLTVKQN
ncbi:PREDICTED: glutaminyl-peptide cyclotransferase-like [Cyphomyrmex costatus]|uniref:Glutaminyl-peptide cyclotransferase n=1 Tax=Cyphomyrmex costatus TaxID=456900 RepID=A0A195CU46_9HYME|nr:PREDICTED: glutaminyl-peptide cyclotransferase-like [Cyphomyrmex costatus]KYN04047.1 Glutaminyl-peptide cyclotransferase [Cyphomyrmex costatus]